MDRRGFLTNAIAATGGAVGLVASSGCAERIGGEGDPAVDRREPPERPDPLSESSVAEYVADFEAVRTHNAHADSGATDVDLTATTTVDYEVDDAYHVTAQHAGTVYHAENGERSVGELYSRPVAYRVTAEETIRLSTDYERAETIGTDDDETDDDEIDDDEIDDGSSDDDETGDDENVNVPLGVRLCNVLDRPREVELKVTRHEATVEELTATVDGSTVLSGTWTIASRQAIELREIASAPGTYRVVARVSENGLTGEGRIDVDLPGIDRAPNADVLSSPSGLSTRALPTLDPI